ncbi:MAG: hypothetical protein IPG90_20890 [Bacteroidetes bacterium]|jgi:hypothetical protein|nr:hypothetical protein [Bacteroidota bacterium]MBP6403092.1 hypothetical protein [Bacteroidia bacterium]MBK6840452.1 hypothetical protein [Bacteroidota bacterium]MBK9523999.1 hypothetical protein [Bacteroidota bacterium]MBK9541741.1 hypothetical protein [Bacteroidota bacterium]
MRFIAKFNSGISGEDPIWLVVEPDQGSEGYLLSGYSELKGPPHWGIAYENLDHALEVARGMGIQHHDWIRQS